MKISGQKKDGGVTFVEMLLALGCGLLMLAGVIAAGVALQRNCAAVEAYSFTEGNQLRVLDYIAMDARRCYSAAVTTDVNGVKTLTLTLPSFYDSSGNPVNPQFDSNGDIGYGNPPANTTIKYYPSGGNFMREVVGTSTNVIATNVVTFTATPQDLNSSIACSITFAPKFTSSGTDNPAGTTVYCNAYLRNPRARK